MTPASGSSMRTSGDEYAVTADPAWLRELVGERIRVLDGDLAAIGGHVSEGEPLRATDHEYIERKFGACSALLSIRDKVEIDRVMTDEGVA